MSLFDTDIVTSSLRVGNGYSVHMVFDNCSNYNLNDVFYGRKLWDRDIDRAGAYVCKIFEDVTIDMFSVWVKESELELTRTLRRYLKKHCLRHNYSNNIRFFKFSPHVYEICFSLPEVSRWDWGANKRITIYPEIKVRFIPK